MHLFGLSDPHETAEHDGQKENGIRIEDVIDDGQKKRIGIEDVIDDGQKENGIGIKDVIDNGNTHTTKNFYLVHQHRLWP